MTRRVSFVRALAVIAVAAIALAGCGSKKKSSSSTSTPSATPSGSLTAPKDPKVAALVPSAVKSRGTLRVALDAEYAPNEFVGPDGKTILGADAELVTALAQVMGLKPKLTNVVFASIIPGIDAGKYDMGASSFTDTKDREKKLDFVTYFSAGTSFFTKSSGGTTVTGLADLCGKKVSVEKGTTQEADATAQGKKCKAAGKPGVTVLAFPDQPGANLALSSGRAQISMADSPVAAYQIKKANGIFKLVGQTYGTAPYGLGVPKNGFAKAVLAGLKDLMSNGTYTKILKKWGIEAGAITSPKIDGAVS